MLEKQRTLELKKHVGAIHSSHGMTLIQRKIANGLLYNAYDELMKVEEHRISIKDLCTLIGYDSNDYKTIKTALTNLLSTVIEWNLVDKDAVDKEGIWNASSIIADASIDGSVCTYSYSKRMKQLLYRPEIYGRLNMSVQARFKSSYGLALYENCIRYQNLEYTPWFEFPVFRKLMGVEEDKYVIFRDFKRRVLDKAVAEVNSYAPINITPNLRKSSRKIIAIRFLIKQTNNHQNGTHLLLEAQPASSLISRLKIDFGLSPQPIEELLSRYEESYVLEKISIIESSPSFLQGKITNLGKYLLDALEKNYQPPKSSKRRVEQESQLKQLDAQKNQALQKKREELVIKYERFVHKSILDVYEQLEGDKKNEVDEKFKQYLGSGGFLELFCKERFANLIVSDQFCVFFKNSFPGLCMSIISYEEFIERHI